MPKAKADVNQQGWEDSEFPILCETCLGDNPYVRMTKQPFGKECKICARPFTIFRWLPGAGMRYKKTEVCQTCAKLKNVCQTCILDLEYGLPVQVRDAALQIQDSLPQNDVNRDYYTQNAEQLMEAGQVGEFHKGPTAGHELLKRLARTHPYYERNRSHICSFFVKGQCKRGDECPYRHEMPPEESELSHQNIKDRFHGSNDPVAKKILGRADKMKRSTPPEDKTITSLFVSGVDGSIRDQDLRDAFYGYGEIKSVSLHPEQKHAYVNYTKREDAEAAVAQLINGVNIKGKFLRVSWARSVAQGPSQKMPLEWKGSYEWNYNTAVPPPPGAAPPPTSSSSSAYYPSQDPRQRGSAPHK